MAAVEGVGEAIEFYLLDNIKVVQTAIYDAELGGVLGDERL